MSQDLQPILIRPETDQFPVDARRLASELGITKDFSTWIKSAISRASAVDGRDYSPYRGDIQGRGKPRQEYALTARTAHHIALMSEGKKAHAYRDALFNLLERIGATPARVPADQTGELRLASIEERKTLTQLWKERGRFTPADFGRVTNRMKIAVGISPTVKKPQMTNHELAANLFAEMVAKNNIVAANVQGKLAVESVSIKAAYDVDALLNGPARAAQIASLRKELG